MAVEQEEIPRLKALYDRGIKNNVRDLTIIEAKGIREREPYCRVKDFNTFFYMYSGKMGINAYCVSFPGHNGLGFTLHWHCRLEDGGSEVWHRL